MRNVKVITLPDRPESGAREAIVALHPIAVELVTKHGVAVALNALFSTYLSVALEYCDVDEVTESLRRAIRDIPAIARLRSAELRKSAN